MKISLTIPTRKRVAGLSNFLDSVISTTSDLSQIEVIIRSDLDDPDTLSVIPKYSSMLRIISCVFPRSNSLGKMYNEMCAVSTGEILGMLSDDNIIKTKNWDIIVRNEICKFDDKIALVFGKDGSNIGIGPTYYFVHKNYIETLGYFNPEQFWHYAGDVWMHDVSKRINRCIFIPDLFIEHLHWCFGKAEKDSVYSEADVHIAQDDSLYNISENGRIADAKKLLDFINNYKK